MSSLTPADDRAREWLERGSLYRWEPVSGKAAGKSIDIFHVEAGRPDAPLLLLVHGFPTSSIDWYDVIDRLAEDYRVCALDFPGYGFSGKPPDWPYSLEVDAGLLVHHLRNVLAASKCRVVAHDRGDSVALLMHHNLSRGEDPAGVTIEHLVLSNGNIFLPLANLTTFQKLILDPDRAKQVLEVMTPAMLAAGMGNTTFTPQRPPGDPTVEALAATLAHNDGISVLHDTVQYLRERTEHEVIWLQSLAASEVPSTVIWGICDTVSPPRVAMHVWEHYLQKKPGSNELWIVPAANHYLQNDRPDAFVEALLHSLKRQGPSDPGPLEATPGLPCASTIPRLRCPTPPPASSSDARLSGPSHQRLCRVGKRGRRRKPAPPFDHLTRLVRRWTSSGATTRRVPHHPGRGPARVPRGLRCRGR